MSIFDAILLIAFFNSSSFIIIKNSAMNFICLSFVKFRIITVFIFIKSDFHIVVSL